MLGKKVLASHMQMSVLKAVVHLSPEKVGFGALLKNDDFIALIAMFVSNFVKPESNTVKKEKVSSVTREGNCKLQLSTPNSALHVDKDIPRKDKNNRRFHRNM